MDNKETSGQYSSYPGRASVPYESKLLSLPLYYIFQNICWTEHFRKKKKKKEDTHQALTVIRMRGFEQKGVKFVYSGRKIYGLQDSDLWRVRSRILLPAT